MGFFRSGKIVFLSLYAALTNFGTLTYAAQATVTLAWDPSSSSSVAGYHLYYGGASKTYTNMLDVGNSSTATLSGLAPGATYFVAVAAYAAQGLEGGLSSEISFTLPAVTPRLQVAGFQSGQALLSGIGQPEHTYDILAAPGVSGWKVIGTVTVDSTGSFRYLDPTSSSALTLMRTYRLQEVTLPEPLPTLSIQRAPPGTLSLNGTGLLGHTYDILATSNFIAWRAIGTVTAGPGGLFGFSVPATTGVGSQFYRLHETTYTLPGTLPQLSISRATGAQVRLTVAGQIGHTYVVAASADLHSWFPIGNGTAGAGGEFEVQDSLNARVPARFYRVGEVLP